MLFFFVQPYSLFFFHIFVFSSNIHNHFKELSCCFFIPSSMFVDYQWQFILLVDKSCTALQFCWFSMQVYHSWPPTAQSKCHCLKIHHSSTNRRIWHLPWTQTSHFRHFLVRQSWRRSCRQFSNLFWFLTLIFKHMKKEVLQRWDKVSKKWCRNINNA